MTEITYIKLLVECLVYFKRSVTLATSITVDIDNWSRHVDCKVRWIAHQGVLKRTYILEKPVYVIAGLYCTTLFLAKSPEYGWQPPVK